MGSHFRTISRMAPAAAIVLALGSVAATPAFAADDGQENFFSAVLGMAGINFGGDKSDVPIDYHERAPLVVPPKLDLPHPLPSANARSQNWPQDPELVKQRKAAEAARAPRTDIDDTHDSAMSARELRRPGTPNPNAQSPSGDCLEDHTCTPAEFWSMLKNTKKQETVQVDLAPGQEPAREYLTQPPPGYLMPTKVVKATAEKPREQGDQDPNDNSSAYFRHLKESQESPQ